ncbi:MAG: CoA pyrophosphatase [Bacteroidota bacterium]
MPIADFISHLQRRLQAPLPGLDAQMQMAPPIRGRSIEVPNNARLGAVMLLLYPSGNDWFIPFIRRVEDGRVHGGQVSFPGGRHDDTDPDFQFTALRETEEEIGVPRSGIQSLGKLTELYIPPSNFVVYPHIGVLPERPAFQANPQEVQEVIEVEISQFLNPEIRDVHRVDVFGGNFIHAPGYTVNQQHLIWGGTAMMLAEFAHLLDELKTNAS